MRWTSLPVTLRQLQYACAVAEELSFRRAAERCHVSQPSLSAQVAELERQLDVRLFERGRRGVTITEAGAVVLARARKVLLATDDLLEAAALHTDPLTGTLRIGVIPTIGPYLLPDLDPALRRAFPSLDLHWTEDKTQVLVELIQTGELDGALLALEAEIGNLECAVLGMDEFLLAGSPSHPLVVADELQLEDLKEQEVLLLDDGHCFRDQVLDLCAVAGATELGFRATSLTTLVQMVAGTEERVTLLPAMAVEVENRRASLDVRRFVARAPHRTIALAWRRGSALADPLRELALVARDAYVEVT